MEVIKFKNIFEISQYRKGVLIDEFIAYNGVTDLGIEDTFNQYFNSLPFYFGIIDDTNFIDVKSSDTINAHPDWQEFISFTEATLPPWLSTGDIAANKELRNATPVEFNINADSKARGIYVVKNDSARSDITGGNNGLLWSTGLFDQVKTFKALDKLLVTYIVRFSE